MKLETILCIENSVLAQEIPSVGFIPMHQVDFDLFLVPQYLWFAPRSIVEHREEFRQIIPYIILHYENQIAVYSRTKKGAEERLHDRLSIGFGGHVALDDISLDGEIINPHKTLTRAVQRELSEEVQYASIKTQKFIGLIYDDSDAVSRVHLGVVELWTLEEPVIISTEDSICECSFVTVDRLQLQMDKMEGWSKLCAAFLADANLVTSNVAESVY